MGTSRGRRQLIGGLAAGAASGLAGLGPRWARAAAPAVTPAPAGEIFDVVRFGAVGDGTTPATAAIQKAIDACGKAGGGMVLVPPGRFLSGALFLRSNVHFHIASGATLLASQRFDDYPPIQGRWEGIERKTHSSPLTGIDLENVTISGRGVIDGQAWPWWQAHAATRTLRLKMNLSREAENPPEAPLRWPRPRLVNLIRCQGVAISDLTMRDGPSWNVHLLYCQDVAVTGITLQGQETQGCDGLVVDSCKRVRITTCSIGSGADCVALKSGYNEDGRRVALPCEDVVITNCNLFGSYGSGLAIGSEAAAGVKNVTLDNCVIVGCRTGIYIRSPRGRGGVIERVRCSNLVIDRMSEAAVKLSHFFDSVRMENRFGEGAAPTSNPETDRSIKPTPTEATPEIRDIDFSGLTVGDSPDVAIIEGLPERFIHRITLREVAAPRARAGVSIQRAADVIVSGLRMDPRDAPAVAARDVERLEVHRLKTSRASAKLPLLRLENVAGAAVRDCDVVDGGGGFVKLEGSANRSVALAGNNVAVAAAPPPPVVGKK